MKVSRSSFSRRFFFSLLAFGAGTLQASSQAPSAKNVVLFIGGGAGLTAWNAASLYKYSKPQTLFMQQHGQLGLADTSTAVQWVTDGAAAASALATGVKPRKGVLSMTADAIKGVSDGASPQTILEYAEQHGLSTGVITNGNGHGVLYGVNAAFYSHVNDRSNYNEVFRQFLQPRFGDGVDVLVATGRGELLADAHGATPSALGALENRKYQVFDSLSSWEQSLAHGSRIAMITSEPEFDLKRAVTDATKVLSKNPKGFILIVYSDCHHLLSPATVMNRLNEIDDAAQAVSHAMPKDTLVIATGDNSQKFVVQGEGLAENSHATKGKDFLNLISMEDQHTAEEVPVLAVGPGSEQVHGFFSNTHVFEIMMSALGWQTNAPSK